MTTLNLLRAAAETKKQEPEFTPGPWDYIASTQHHGPYVAGPWGGDICDCYAMGAATPLNNYISKPFHHQHERADANARLISAAPDMFAVLEIIRDADEDCKRDGLLTLPTAVRARIDAALSKALEGK